MDPTSSITIITKALDGLAMRSAATAQNIANLNAARYRPVQVDFEASLREAAALGPEAVRDMPLAFSAAPFAPGDEPRLDMELANAAETSLRYGALLDLLGRHGMIMRSAIRGGQ